MEQPFGGYRNSFQTPYANFETNSHSFDRSAFWYRANENELMYEAGPLQFEQRLHLPGAAADLEQSSIKHRRTRSGCFTCRSRRVKCDENRPVCDRCRKGNRGCEFPQPVSSKRVKHSDTRAGSESASQAESKEDVAEVNEEQPEGFVSSKKISRPSGRGRSNSSYSVHAQSRASPAGNTPSHRSLGSPISPTSSSSRSRTETPASSAHNRASSSELHARQARIRALKPEMQRYLQFQQDHMTYHHYFFKWDPDDFLHQDFIDLALEYEPLLYAIVGFAAYHYELRQDEGRLNNIFKYYNGSLGLLRKSLERNETITEAMLLTVLQLECFEESIGDLVNFFGHHRAATSMFKSLLTPETMTASLVSRQIFHWYTRFDVIVGLAGGTETNLDRSWYSAGAEWSASQIDTDVENDLDLNHTIAWFMAANRLIGFDLSRLHARMPRGEVSVEEFVEQNNNIAQRVQEMRLQIQQYNDEFYTVQEFPFEKIKPLTKDDIVNPYLPGGLFKDALWPLNYMWLDWYAIDLWQRFRTSVILGQPFSPDLVRLGLEMSRLYEAMSRWPDAPAAVGLGFYSSLATLILFLPKDERHISWARQKLDQVERAGYIFPSEFRTRTAQMWKLTEADVGEDESIEKWWVCNDQGRPRLIAELKQLVADRRAASRDNPTATMVDLRNSSTDIRDLKAVFSRMDISGGDDTPTSHVGDSSSQSPRSTDSSGTSPSGGPNSSIASQGSHRGSGMPVISSSLQPQRRTDSVSVGSSSTRRGRK